MIVRANNKTFTVRFSHCKGENINECTHCEIVADDDSIKSTGIATKNPKDNFNKEIGRQLALRRALIYSYFDKELRTIFWNTYKNWGKEKF